MSELVNNVLDSVNILVNAAVSDLKYDVTRKCTISDNTNADRGEYYVTDGASYFNAYSTTTTYEVGDVVLVTIPQNDYTNQKIIVGKSTSDDSVYYTYIAPSSSFVPLFNYNVNFSGDNGLTANGTLSSLAADEISSVDMSLDLYDRLYISADFQSLLNETIDNGTYGLKILLTTEGYDDNNELVEKTYPLYLTSKSDMFGNPYQYIAYTTQEKVFDVSGVSGDIKSIKVSFFQDSDFVDAEGNIYQLDVDEEDIKNLFVQNVKISLGLNKSSLIDNQVVLYTSDSKIYTDNQTSNLYQYRNKTLKCRYIYKNNDDYEFIEDSNGLPAGTVVHWYRYRWYPKVKDDLAGNFWEEIPQKSDYAAMREEYVQLIADHADAVEKNDTNTVNELQEKISVYSSFIINEEYNKCLDSTTQMEYIAVPQFGVNEEEYKVIIESPTEEYQYYLISQDDDLKGITVTYYSYTTTDIDGNEIEKYVPCYAADSDIEYTKASTTLDKLTVSFLANLVVSIPPITTENAFGGDEADLTYFDIYQEYSEYEKKLQDYLDDVATYESDILTLTNEEQTADRATQSRIMSLTLNCDNGGVFKLYDENNFIRSSADASKKRTITANYEAFITGDSDIDAAEQIEWIVPKISTMIELPSEYTTREDGTLTVNSDGNYWHIIKTQNYADTIADLEVGSIIDRSNTLLFTIKEYYSPSFVNNTIQCIVTKNSREISRSLTLTFGQNGTSGSDNTLLITPSDIFSDETQEITATANFYDANGEELTSSCTFTWELIGEPTMSLNESENASECILVLNDNIKISAFTPAVLQCTAKYNNGTFVAYYPLAYRIDNTYDLYGATKILYDASGSSPSYYKDIYKLYQTDIENSKISLAENQTFTIVYPAEAGYTRYYPEFDDDKPALKAKQLYIDGMATHPFLVRASSNNNIRYAQTVYILLNRYASSTLNQWDGSLQIDEENNQLLSAMVGAGKKHSDNTFSGVLMGDVGNTIDESKTGIYGYDHGEQSFAFKQDGTAFIGKSGTGRIEFNGDEGIIKSANWDLTPHQGAYFNLKDGYLKMNSSSSIAKVKVTDDNLASVQTSGVTVYQKVEKRKVALPITINNKTYNIEGSSSVYSLEDNATDIKYYKQELVDKTYDELMEYTPVYDGKTAYYANGEPITSATELAEIYEALNTYLQNQQEDLVNRYEEAYQQYQDNLAYMEDMTVEDASYTQEEYNDYKQDLAIAEQEYLRLKSEVDALVNLQTQTYTEVTKEEALEIQSNNQTVYATFTILTQIAASDLTEDAVEDNNYYYYTDTADNQATVVLSASPNETSDAYFKVKSTSGNTLIDMENNEYYLQSDNYERNKQGSKLDLVDGWLQLGSNFYVDSSGNLTANSGKIGGITLNSSGLSTSKWHIYGNGTAYFNGITADNGKFTNVDIDEGTIDSVTIGTATIKNGCYLGTYGTKAIEVAWGQISAISNIVSIARSTSSVLGRGTTINNTATYDAANRTTYNVASLSPSYVDAITDITLYYTTTTFRVLGGSETSNTLNKKTNAE